jgi:Flp pilus assembly protein TadD
VRRRPAVAGLVAALVLGLLASGVSAWLAYQERVSAQARQRLTEQEILNTVSRVRNLLEVGWQAHDLAKLKEAESEARRAVQLASNNSASASVQSEAESMLTEAVALRSRAEKTRILLDRILDAAVWQRTSFGPTAESGRHTVLAAQGVDESYASAFRDWGLDIDETKESDIVARLRAEPDVVLQEVIAGLDNWMLLRRQERRPEAEWRILYRLANEVDKNEHHRRLRALLAGESMPYADLSVGIIGTGQPWHVSLGMACAHSWRQAQELRKEIDVRSASVLTVALLSQGCIAVGDLDGAAEVLQVALTDRPGEVVLLYSMGKLCLRRGPSQLGKAIEYYRAARTRRPRMGLALSLALIQANRASEAEGILNELVREQPQNHVFCTYLGMALDAQQKQTAAEAAFRKCVDLRPNSALMHNNLGIALARQDNNVAAEASYRQAISLRPNFAQALSNLGIALMNQRKTGEAAEVIRKAIGLEPEAAEAHFRLGTVLREQKRFADAETAFRKAIELSPDDAESYVRLGLTLIQLGKHAAGETAFRKACKLAPGNYAAHYNLAVNLYGQEKYVEAESAYRKAIECQPDSAPAYQNLAVCLLQQGQYDEALKSQKMACELFASKDPERPKALSLLGHCERSALLNARLPAILRGSEKPATAAERVELARICTQKKLYAAAAQFYVEAFAKQPTFAEQVKSLARFRAAGVAAQAGCGFGVDAKKLNDKERVRWRRQALEWLRRDLVWWTKAIDDGKAQTRDDARQWLEQCRADGKFDCIRDHESLLVLPQDERAEWEQFWIDVDSLLRRLAVPDKRPPLLQTRGTQRGSELRPLSTFGHLFGTSNSMILWVRT